MNHKKDKLIFYLIGVGSGMVISGIVMLGIALEMQEQVSTERQIQKTQVLPIYQSETHQKVNESTTSSSIQVLDVLSVEIPQNATSKDISKLLEGAGVIEDANAFNDYIKGQNKQRALHYGHMTFPVKGEYMTILDILLGKDQ